MLADDHPLLLKGVASILSEVKGFYITGLAENGQKLLELVKQNPPHIAIIDLEMPVLNGFKTLEALNTNFPSVKSIIYSSYYDKYIARELIISGARGYLAKHVDMDKFINTILKVHAGGYCMDAVVCKMVLDISFKRELYKREVKLIGLSERELQILKLICNEKTNAAIATELNLSIATIDFHRRSIYKKTNTGSIVGLIKYAINVGLG